MQNLHLSAKLVTVEVLKRTINTNETLKQDNYEKCLGKVLSKHVNLRKVQIQIKKDNMFNK